MWKRDQGVPPSPQPEPHVDPARVPAAPAPEMRVVNSSLDRNGVDLGKSVVIKGELSASEDLTLHGQMQGKISLPEHTLTIGAQAEVKADITAKAVVVVGMITGRVSAQDRVDIRSTGTIAGDIVSPRLIIAEGGTLRGKVEMP